MSTCLAAALVLFAASPLNRIEAAGYLDQVTVGYRGAEGESAVEAHLGQLAEVGLDGVGLERPLAELADPRARERHDGVARRVRAAAEAQGLGFHIIYTLEGDAGVGWAERLQRDWSQVLGAREQVTGSPAYARQDGRPVVVLRGLGALGAPGTVAEAMDVIDWFKDQGCYVVGGVPPGWRTGAGARENFLSAWARLDALQPWSVGAFAGERGARAHAERVVAPDRALAAQLGLAYQQVLFPAATAPTPSAARFFWAQAYFARLAGVSAVLAGLDGWAGATAPGGPSGDGAALALDADGEAPPLDFELRLAGAAAQMLKGGRAVPDVPVLERAEPAPLALAPTGALP